MKIFFYIFNKTKESRVIDFPIACSTSSTCSMYQSKKTGYHILYISHQLSWRCVTLQNCIFTCITYIHYLLYFESGHEWQKLEEKGRQTNAKVNDLKISKKMSLTHTKKNTGPAFIFSKIYYYYYYYSYY